MALQSLGACESKADAQAGVRKLGHLPIADSHVGHEQGIGALAIARGCLQV